MKEQLNDEEIVLIEQFCANEKMFEAVRKVMLEGIYSHGVIKAGYKHDALKNGALSLASLSSTNPIPDEALGANVRGIWAGLNALENAYTSLKSIKSKGVYVKTPYNEAI